MKRKFLVILTCLAGFTVVIILTCYLLVVANASGRTFYSVTDIPRNRVALLLATSPVTPRGAHNFYFDNRIIAADSLYKAGKIDCIISSGGDYTRSHRYGCDEPAAIRDSLVARGVPAKKIILDYEGTRTLNSIAKVAQVYGVDSITLISQKYHNERAIWLADRYGIHTVGYNAPHSPILRNRVKNILREFLARVKMFLDIATGCQPDIAPQ